MRGGDSSPPRPATSLSNETLAPLIKSLSHLSHLDHQILLSNPPNTPVINYQQLLARIFRHWSSVTSEQTLEQNENRTTLQIKSFNTLFAKISMTFQIQTLIQQSQNQSFIYLEQISNKKYQPKYKKSPYQILVQLSHHSPSGSMTITYSVHILPSFFLHSPHSCLQSSPSGKDDLQFQSTLEKFQEQFKKNIIREIGFLKSRSLPPPLPSAHDDQSLENGTSSRPFPPRVLNRRILMESLNPDAPSLSSSGGSSSSHTGRETDRGVATGGTNSECNTGG
jgi:hypothetical protein